MPLKPHFPSPPHDLSEESHIEWCRAMGRYLAQAGYGKKAIATVKKWPAGFFHPTLQHIAAHWQASDARLRPG